MIGLAAVFIAVAACRALRACGIAAKADPIPAGNRLELFLGAAIGAITFSGSVIAFGKLSAPTSSACSRARRWCSPASTC
jgi:NAD(P) transhydrogenase subunit beta